MSNGIVWLSLAGVVFFAVRLFMDPVHWLTYAVGIAACLFVWVRQRTVGEANSKIATTPSLREIEDETTLDEVLASERAIVYKHSTSCPVSAVVIDEVLRFADRHPSWPVHVVQVIEHRDLSDTVSEQLGVRHESPQALVLRDGRCIWHTSHGGITAHRLGQHLAQEPTPASKPS